MGESPCTFRADGRRPIARRPQARSAWFLAPRGLERCPPGMSQACASVRSVTTRPGHGFWHP